MAHEFVWVEARRHVAQQIIVLDLEMGERYLLPREYADKLIQAEVVRVVAPGTPGRVEAAARAVPTRRG